MIVGLPKETKDGERRIALTPQAIRDLTALGHAVRVERAAGQGAGFTDDEYRRAGAVIVEAAAQAFDADLVIKVKEIQAGEIGWLRPDSTLFGFLHLGADRTVASALIDKRVTAIAYEAVEDKDGALPLLAPMSAISGELAVFIAAHLLLAPQGGRGVTLRDARVLILGAGHAGAAAAEVARRHGAAVTLLSRPGARLSSLAGRWGSDVHIAAATPDALLAALAGADVLIGAVQVRGAATPKLIGAADLAKMGAGAVFIDLSIDGGGIAATSRETSHSRPTFVAEGVIHYAVGNVPAAVPRSASIALSQAVLPYAQQLARGIGDALRGDAGLARGLQLLRGLVVQSGLAQTTERPLADADALLHAC